MGGPEVKIPILLAGDGRECSSQEDTDVRLSLAIRLERTGLIFRYVAYLVLTAIFMAGYGTESYRDLAVITVVVGLHAAFVHAVLWMRRYELFASPLNFAIHVAELSLVVFFTGAEESEFFTLYLLFIVGYTVYRRSFGRMVFASVLTCGAYITVILIEWWMRGLALPFAVIFVKVGSIPVCGWIVATTNILLQSTEEALAFRAAALTGSEAMLRAIVDNTAEPILVYDENEIITEANNRACEFLGIFRENLLGKPFRSLLFDDGTLAEQLAASYEHSEYHGEQIFINSDGVERTVDLHVRSFIRNGRKFFVAISRDITEQKELQEATQLASARLGHLNRELRQVNELKTSLLASVSQRLRSPLTAILGYLDLMLSDELGVTPPEQRRALLNSRRSLLKIFGLLDEAFESKAVRADMNFAEERVNSEPVEVGKQSPQG